MTSASSPNTIRSLSSSPSYEGRNNNNHNISRRNRSNNRNLIIHGEDAERGRYPYFVWIGGYCGGSLIAPDIVACAGHCLPSLHHQQDILIHVGRYHRHTPKKDDKNDHNVEVFAIAKMVRHPDWHRLDGIDDAFASDFALIQLNGTSTKPVVRLNRDPHVPFPGRQDVIALGLGIMNTATGNNERQFAETLQQVTLNPVSNQDCAASRGSRGQRRRNITYRGHIDNSMLCTSGGEHNQRDACDYDSGSPVIIPGNDESNKHDIVVAMVSWGILCADPDFPGVNSRISNASAWMDEMVCNWSSVPPADFGCTHDSSFQPFRSFKQHIVLGPLVVFLIVLVIVACAVLPCFKCCCGKLRSGKRRAANKAFFREDSKSTTAEEQQELVAGLVGRCHHHNRQQRRGNSYDSIEMEVTVTSDD